MALRRSPRLRPSGSSSGSSSGIAPGSGPHSSSPSSPHSPESLEDPDSGSDFEASLRPRGKRGPPRGAPRSHVPKRRRRSGKDLEQNSLLQEPNSLLQAVLSGKAAMEPVVDEWLERYRRDRESAFLELLNCTVGCAGCRGVVTPEMFRELQNSEIIQRLAESFQEEGSPAPGRALASVAAALVRRGRRGELWDGFLLDSWLPFLTGLAHCPLRPFRRAGTEAALQLLSSLVEVAVAVGQQEENSRRQLGAQRGKDPERTELLEGRLGELREQQEELEVMMNQIFKGVFVHRYRDVVAEIRALCLQELGNWVRKFPRSFLTDGHLKYLGWSLHDKEGEVRLSCVRALQGIYGIPETAPSLELFTSRFKGRLVAMAHDKEPRVALEVLRLLSCIHRNLEEALSDEDCQRVFPLVFVSSRALASAAGEFLYHRLLDPDRRGQGPGDNRSFFLSLVRFFLRSQLHEHGAFLVDSLWDCAGTRLRDWETSTALLLGTGTSLDLCEEQALVELLSCSGLRVCRGQPPPGRAQGRKVSSRDWRREKSRLSRSLIPVLPQLLEKFSAEPEAAAALLELLQHLELGLFHTARWEKCLERVLGRIQDVFGKHSRPGPALPAASGALRALCDPRLSLHRLGDIARGRLGDALADRCHLQVTEILQAASPDEEDLYGLAATLRRLAALFNDHDLTRWGLFVPLSRLLRHGLDGGDLTEQVTVPALSCLFFHLLWELSRVPDSEAPPGDVVSRVSLLVSLCRSCLAEPRPQLREKAFLVLSDLLLVLGPETPPEPELQSQLGLALTDLVFTQNHPKNHEEGAVLEQLQEVQGRRRLLAGFCKLLLGGVLELGAAADVFKHYGKFHGDFGDIIRETLRATRDRLGWARTLLLTLTQLFTELLLQEGPGLRRLPEFREIGDLGRRFSLLFSLRHLRHRPALLQLHSEGIRFSLGSPPAAEISGIPGIPGGIPLNLPFLEVLSEFSPRLLRPDRALLLSLLEKTCRERGLGPDFGSNLGDFGANLGDFGAPLLCYRRSLRAKGAPSSGGPSSSPWPPSPDLTSTLLRGGPRHRGPSPHPLSSESRRTWGSRLSLMEEEEEEEEEETPKTPRSPLEQPRDLFGSSSLEVQTF